MDHKGVLVCADLVGGTLSPDALEILGGGRRIADERGEGLSCLLLGDAAGEAAAEAIAYGADAVYVAESAALAGCPSEACVPVVERLLAEQPARTVLFSQAHRDLAVRLAFRFGVSLSTNCTAFEVDPESKRLRQTRPVYGGKAYTVATSTSLPEMVTVRAKAFPPAQREPARTGRVVQLETGDLPGPRTKVVGTIEDADTVRLDAAKVLVSGGRGVGGAEGFGVLLKPLAEALRGEVSSSRPPVDNGWISKTRLVGITGSIVAPELYVAVGISGTVQHMTGCRSAKTIVAINKDPEAAIFEYADFGVVGPFEEVLPALTCKLAELADKDSEGLR